MIRNSQAASPTPTRTDGASRATQNATAAAQTVRRAVPLAAGKGERLYPLTANTPKCLIEIGGESLVERALRALATDGVAEATIVVGYNGEVVRDRAMRHVVQLQPDLLSARDNDGSTPFLGGDRP